jgi:hypothetical protein
MWVEDQYKCLDFVGRFNIEVADIFEKGKLMEKRYKREDNSELVYMPKVYTGKQLFEAAYLQQEASLKYDIWFYPEEYTKNIEFSKNTVLKKQIINPILKEIDNIIVEGKDDYYKRKDNLEKELSEIKSRFFEFTFKEKSNGLKMFHVYDQYGQEQIINSYLSKLTINKVSFENKFQTKEIGEILKDKRYLHKINLPIDNIKGLLHYVKCIRFINHTNDKILISPDMFMKNKKGTKYEHAIYLACLMMNYYSTRKSLDDENLLESGNNSESSSIINKDKNGNIINSNNNNNNNNNNKNHNNNNKGDYTNMGDEKKNLLLNQIELSDMTKTGNGTPNNELNNNNNKTSKTQQNDHIHTEGRQVTDQIDKILDKSSNRTVDKLLINNEEKDQTKTDNNKTKKPKKFIRKNQVTNSNSNSNSKSKSPTKGVNGNNKDKDKQHQHEHAFDTVKLKLIYLFN